MKRAAFIALMLAGLSGCAHHGRFGGQPSDIQPTSEGFPILKSFINNAVDRDSPNL